MQALIRTYIFPLFLAFFSLLSPAYAAGWMNEADKICQSLQQGKDFYLQGNHDRAIQQINNAYFQQYDVAMEPAVRTNISGGRVFAIEESFRQLIQLITTPGTSNEQFIQAVNYLCRELKEDAINLTKADANEINSSATISVNSNSGINTFNNNQSASTNRIADATAAAAAASTTSATMSAFVQSFIILLREGFEALLVITALLAFLNRAQMNDKSNIIYRGVGLGILASIITAYLFATVFVSSFSNREALEGVIMLIAAGVLVYVSYWLFSHGEKRKLALQEKLKHVASGGSVMGLGIAAFLAVYREGAEAILFYQALYFQHDHQILALIAGFILGLVALIVLYKIMRQATIKIPFRLFFTATAIFLYVMAFSFIGRGISELQEAHWISTTQLEHFPHLNWLNWLGIIATSETIIAQLIFLIPSVMGLIWWYHKKQKLVVEQK